MQTMAKWLWQGIQQQTFLSMVLRLQNLFVTFLNDSASNIAMKALLGLPGVSDLDTECETMVSFESSCTKT